MKSILSIVLVLAMFFGECRCIYKMVNCNWNPIGKAEVIYTISTFTGFGAVVGYFNIEDK